MSYHHILSLAGWIKKTCSSCSGNAKAKYEHPDKAGEKVEIFKKAGLFKYSKNGVKISGGSVESLHHHHFVQ